MHLSEASDATGLPKAPSLRREGRWVFSSPHLPRYLFSIFWSLHCVPTSHPSSSITCFLVCKAHRLLATELNMSSSFKRSFPKLWDLHRNPSKKQANLIKRRSEVSWRTNTQCDPFVLPASFSSGSLCMYLSQNSHAWWAHSSPLIALWLLPSTRSAVHCSFSADKIITFLGRQGERVGVLKSSEADYLLIAGADFKIKHLI